MCLLNFSLCFSLNFLTQDSSYIYTMKNLLFLLFASIISISLSAQEYAQDIIVGAEQPEAYLPMLKGKKVGMLVNQTSLVKDKHLVDFVIERGADVNVIFAPEHGFRGKADAGAHVKNGVDTKTGLPIISLYGKNKKPSATQLKNVDVVVFDIQDVGARFYTYISSLQYMMEACAENKKALIVLDRPNPNGFYVDGPVLNKKYKSFVGMQPIPVVHGMTVGEYAKMLNGEGWLKNKVECPLAVIPCENYDHSMLYDLPVAPSPNLRSKQAILMYPSLCFFEGTEVSVGRGTPFPFEVWGHPEYKNKEYSFTPRPGKGSKNPRYKYQRCNGNSYHWSTDKILKMLDGKLNIDILKEAYGSSKRTDGFFTSFFEKLTGTGELRKQIMAKKSVAEIRKSWEPELSKFKKIRKKYLLYEDFE